MCIKPSHSIPALALKCVYFKDLLTGNESVNHNERVDEEVVSSSLEAEEEEEEQEDVVISKPDGEVRNNTEFNSIMS